MKKIDEFFITYQLNRLKRHGCAMQGNYAKICAELKKLWEVSRGNQSIFKPIERFN